MSEKKLDTFFEFNNTNLNIAAFNISNDKLEYYKEYPYLSYFANYKELNFDKINKILEDSIFEFEKSTKEFLKDIYLIVETTEQISIQMSIRKNNEGNLLAKEDAIYLIQDAKQQVLRSNNDLRIIHIIVENYILDGIKHDLLPVNKKCKKFSIDIKFICFPKDLKNNFKNLFFKHQIDINRFISLNYLNEFNFKNIDTNACEKGRYIIKGINKQEVALVPKEHKKKGFFERLFHFFK
tara:strand:- start:297 stop:1010 length:714 start_codon:yes stop_codon:yes gene_type:complete